MEPVIHLRDAVVVLGRFPALAGATLRVDRGEIVALRGPNGAGKTTLLRVCAGLVAVARGDAVVLGTDLTRDRRAVRARVGLLGHGNGLYDDLSVGENVRFWGRTVGATPDEIDSAITRLGLSGRLADTPVGRLSAGQRRRTALARVMLTQAPLWLLDEPLNGLDSDGRERLEAAIRDHRLAGGGVLAASHQPLGGDWLVMDMTP